MNAIVKHTLEPIYDSESRVLILGSLPSVLSRKMNFYYANPQNRFWKVLHRVFEDDNPDLPAFCHDHHIALWDVIRQCCIKGSSDASISNVEVNDLSLIFDHCSISMIFTTGKKASQLFDQYIKTDIPCIHLPSTSSANASMDLQVLTERYLVIKKYANE